MIQIYFLFASIFPYPISEDTYSCETVGKLPLAALGRVTINSHSSTFSRFYLGLVPRTMWQNISFEGNSSILDVLTHLSTTKLTANSTNLIPTLPKT